jgi:hypothetical protein
MKIFDIAYRTPGAFREEHLILTTDYDAAKAVRLAQLKKFGMICVVASPTDRRVEGVLAL